MRAALMHGTTENEILDLINQIAGFVGAPRAVNGMRAAAKLLDMARGDTLPNMEEKIVSIGDHETLIKDNGEDGPIIPIYALSMDCRMWKDVLPKLASVARVIAYDMRGHGQARAAHLRISRSPCQRPADPYGCPLHQKGRNLQSFFMAEALPNVSHLRTPTESALWHSSPPVRKPCFPLNTRNPCRRNGMENLVPESIIRWFLPEAIANNGWMVRYARSYVRKARVEDWAAAWRATADLDYIDRVPEMDFLCWFLLERRTSRHHLR
jgi:3-oxoadipate enol-lactonase